MKSFIGRLSTHGLTILAVVGLSTILVPTALAERTMARLRQADGKLLDMTSIRFASDQRVTGISTEGTVDLSARDILSIEFSPSDRRPSRHPALLIGGGEILHGELNATENDTIEVKNDFFGTAVIPLTAIEGILLGERVTGKAKTVLIDRIRRLPRQADAILLANGDVLEGTVTKFGPEEWEIDREGKSRGVAAKLLRGVALDKNLLEYKPSSDFHAQITLADGSIIKAKEILAKDGTLEVQTLVGPVIKLTWSTVGNPGLARIDYRNGRVVFLSDIDPIETVTKPFLDDRAPPKKDENVAGGTLRVAGKTYSKGVGVRSYTRLDYDAASFGRFLATVGIDDAASDEASLEFRVLLDDKVAFDSKEMTTATDPKLIDLPIGSAKKLSLEVDYARRGDIDDLADWCDARLIRPADKK